MSEESPIYGQGPARPAIYKRFGEGYERPTPAEVKAEVLRSGLTGAQCATLLGFRYSREVRKLTSGEKLISYSVWRRLCEYTGSVQPDTRANYVPEASEASQQRQPREKPQKGD
ncbi:hypothetical protein ACJJJB_00280 (plasmid) [Microbulbifer sp. ANSA001]|uniref:hypothetical protein n=1 Tax=Microbulbifer sp. ANSA001 TaxID=3243358 RepID=UPI004040F744